MTVDADRPKLRRGPGEFSNLLVPMGFFIVARYPLPSVTASVAYVLGMKAPILSSLRV